MGYGYILISLEVKQTMEIIDNPILDDKNSLIKKIVDLVKITFFAMVDWGTSRFLFLTSLQCKSLNVGWVRMDSPQHFDQHPLGGLNN